MGKKEGRSGITNVHGRNMKSSKTVSVNQGKSTKHVGNPQETVAASKSSKAIAKTKVTDVLVMSKKQPSSLATEAALKALKS